MPPMEEVYSALRAAHAAGDTEAAGKLAAYIKNSSTSTGGTAGKGGPPPASAAPSSRRFGNLFESGSSTGQQRMWFSDVPAVGSAVANGMTLGLSRHAEAAGNYLSSKVTGQGGTYKDALKQGEDKRAALAERAPGLQGMAEIGGAFMSPGAMAKYATRPSLWKMMGTGAGEGATAGAAYSTTSDSSPMTSTLGTGLGTMLGAISPLLTVAGAKAYPWLKDKISRLKKVTPEKAAATAEKELYDLATGEGKSMLEIARRRAELGPKATVAEAAGDLGEEALALTAAESPKVRQQIEKGFLPRMRGAADDFTRNVEAATGKRVVDAEALPKLLRDNMNKAAAENYGAVRGELVEITDDIAAILKRGEVKKGVQEAKIIASTKGKKFFESFDDEGALIDVIDDVGDVAAETAKKKKPPQYITVEELDNIKQGIDSVLTRKDYRNSDFGWLNARGKALNSAKNELLEKVDDLMPEYASARAAYAGDRSVVLAAEEGNKFLKMSPEDLRAVWREYGESQKEAFRTRATAAIAQKAKSAGAESKSIWSFLESAGAKEKAEIVFGKDKAKKIMAAVDRTDTMMTTGKAAQQGSRAGVRGRTQEVTQAQKADDALHGAHYPYPSVPSVVYAAGRQASRVLSHLKGHPPEVVEGIGRILMSSGNDVTEMMTRIASTQLSRGVKTKVLKDLAQIRAAQRSSRAIAGGAAAADSMEN